MKSAASARLVTAAAAVALCVAVSAAAAQTADRPASGAGSAAAPPARSSPAPSPTVPPRQRIDLSPTDRQAIERSNPESIPPIPPRKEDDGLLPTAADLTSPPIEERQTRIEQVRTDSNRISEVIVSPALGSPSFVMTNREGRQPLTQTDLGGGLSVPKFFRWEFGGATPAPAPLAVPPPPTR